jgi:hypothetical protein
MSSRPPMEKPGAGSVPRIHRVICGYTDGRFEDAHN